MANPVIELDGEGVASIISYNVPEPTAYSGTNIIELDFPEDWFVGPDDSDSTAETPTLHAVSAAPLAVNLVKTDGAVVDTLLPSATTLKSATTVRRRR